MSNETFKPVLNIADVSFVPFGKGEDYQVKLGLIARIARRWSAQGASDHP